MSSFNRYLDELYFYMQEFYKFETKFISNLSQNIIIGDIACLVDAEEIDKWKANVEYDNCLEFVENYDKINFDKFQTELHKQNIIKHKIDLKSYETLDEVCNSLKHTKRISIISQQFFCYLNKITYSPTMFHYYTKNNQLIIYFGTGKSLFIPNYSINKKIDSENIYVVDLPQNKQTFIESIFKSQNMSDTLMGERSLSLSMNNLLNYTINKNSIKKNKTYNFYANEEDDYIHSKINPSKNNNVHYSKNIYINYSSNINLDTSNNNNNNVNNYQKVIEINKPYIKDNNEDNKDIVEEYHYSQNIDNNNIKGNIEDEKSSKNDDNFVNNKNEEYNNGYKNSYKDKEVEYVQILKEKNNNIENKENINKNLISNSNSENNTINIKTNVIQQNIEVEIKEEKNIPQPNTIIQNVIENNIINNIEELKESQNSQDININNLKTNKESVKKEKKDNEIQEVIGNTPNPDENIINIETINKINLNNKKDNQEVNKNKIKKIGLDNFKGKSSYINAVIQCLSYTVPLTNYILDEKNKNKIIQNNISKNNPNAPQLSPSYFNLIEALWSNNPKIEILSPSEVKTNLELLNKSFEQNEENEISELILFILEQLHLELNDNKIVEDNIKKLNDNKNITKDNFYKQLSNNKSIIYETFFGGVCEVVQECKNCKEESNLKNIENKKTYEYKNLNYLMFPINEVFALSQKINQKEFIDIYDCLNYFQTPIVLDGDNGRNCEKCGKVTPYILTTKINSCQNNLLVFLKRDFKNENIKFKFDDILDITEYVQKNNDKLIYNLYGIISLRDNKEIHHVAFCKDLIENIWYKYDDNVVEIVNNLENDIFNFGIPVALFYQKEAYIEETKE